jgi:hypothetical protein
MAEKQDGTTISGGTFNIKGQTTFGANSPITTPGPYAEEKQVLKVLLVFAVPANLQRLSLGDEDRAIHEAWRLGRKRDSIEIKSLHAATIDDLRRALLDKPDIVHIAGHGTPGGAMLNDEGGLSRILPLKAMEALFEDRNDEIRSVVLNYCHSLPQGHLLARHVPYTIVIDGQLYDHTALEFARGFYDDICTGEDIVHAYAEGRRTVHVKYPEVPFSSQLLAPKR